MQEAPVALVERAALGALPVQTAQLWSVRVVQLAPVALRALAEVRHPTRAERTSAEPRPRQPAVRVAREALPLPVARVVPAVLR